MKRSYQKWIGNGLIILGIGLIFLLFLPYLLAFLPKKTPAVKIPTDFALTIPKISAHSLIIPDVDPWNRDIYQKALRMGVAHAKETALPDEIGTMYIFAHSSSPPWEILWRNPDFLRLGELVAGDKITITYKETLYTYEVVSKKVVWPTETQYLSKDGEADLILQTCTPMPTAYKRLLVFARKVI